MSDRTSAAERYSQRDGETDPFWFVPCPDGWAVGPWRESVEIWAAEEGIDMPIPQHTKTEL